MAQFPARDAAALVAGHLRRLRDRVQPACVTPRLLGGGRVQVLATEIYTQMLEIGDWGMAALLGAALTIVTLLGIALYQLLGGGPVRGKR